MTRRWIVVFKTAVHAACTLPLAYLAWRLALSFGSRPGALGPDPSHAVARFTGFGALRLLVLALAVTPLRRFFPRLAWLIRFRRMFGLWAFAYACVHLLAYLWLRAGWNFGAIADDMGRQPGIWAGIAAWASLLPLAATSTALSIRWLGGRNWQRLHRLAYVAAAAGVLHAWCMARPGGPVPLVLTIALAVLLGVRLLPLGRRRSAFAPSK